MSAGPEAALVDPPSAKLWAVGFPWGWFHIWGYQERFPSSQSRSSLRSAVRAQILEVGQKHRFHRDGAGAGAGLGSGGSELEAAMQTRSRRAPLGTPMRQPAGTVTSAHSKAQPTGNDGAGSADVRGSRSLPVTRVTLGVGQGAQRLLWAHGLPTHPRHCASWVEVKGPGSTGSPSSSAPTPGGRAAALPALRLSSAGHPLHWTLWPHLARPPV